MSSKRIAELIGKRHDHVVRDIKNMACKLERNFSSLENLHYQIIKDERYFVSKILLGEVLSLMLVIGFKVGS